MITPDHIRAHRHSSYHRDELGDSELCGCFYCCAVYPPVEIHTWVDDDLSGVGQTALSPRCMIDSVIGSASGYPITEEFLGTMNRHWF
jgi:hypothetical protein